MTTLLSYKNANSPPNHSHVAVAMAFLLKSVRITSTVQTDKTPLQYQNLKPCERCNMFSALMWCCCLTHIFPVRQRLWGFSSELTDHFVALKRWLNVEYETKVHEESSFHRWYTVGELRAFEKCAFWVFPLRNHQGMDSHYLLAKWVRNRKANV